MATLYPYDANAALHDGTALTATGVGTVAYYDVGASARFPAVAVASITALDATTGNETYDLVIEGSTDTAFTTPVQLGSRVITTTGRHTILFDNDQAGVVYRYIRYKPVLAGTTPILTGPVFLAPLDPVC
ncbi:hypothetical protein KOAAANKH_02535 [Brevundimonas sp. NIBR10]|uniref:hypothetical protein n=1 Tax=Brevundimonas sp. NIBR10 TaxID=3015997 RepID=UPI0022F14AF4|nr:hypothetical protein [Brevundimonas sp. NIBR10]WGM47653.1 hypothetical protein KOAAANKH_02535 [Brevundimonas sp. NIBR10]